MQDLRAQLRQTVEQEMQQDPAHDIAHLDRVWANARRIGEDEGGVNMKVLLAGAYLHDLVNLPKDAPNRAEASTLSADAAKPILEGLGYSPDEIRAAQHVIAAHSYSAGIAPESFEAEILRAQPVDREGRAGLVGGIADLDPRQIGIGLERARFPVDFQCNGHEMVPPLACHKLAKGSKLHGAV